jgi:hypothetical protein
MLAVAGTAHAQFAAVSVNIPPKAAIRVDTKDPTLKSAGSSFADYGKISTFTYRILSGSENGSAGVTLKVTTGFGGAGGASVASRPAGWDTLSYTCTLSVPASASAGSTASVTDCSDGIKPAEAGGTGSISWVLTSEIAKDKRENTGARAVVVTFTVHSI